MCKWIFGFVTAFLFCAISFYGMELSEYPYQSKYDEMYSNMNDIETLTNTLNSSDPDLVISALKRVGELKIASTKAKVESILAESNPGANLGKTIQTANYKNVFYVAILVLGKIGDDKDGALLASYLQDTRDPIGISILLQGMGDLTNSQAALNTLNEFSLNVHQNTDGRIVVGLVRAMDTQNSRSSIGPLFRLAGRVPQAFKEMVNDTIRKINKTGRTAEKNNK